MAEKNTEEKKNVFIYYLKDNPDNIRDFDPTNDEKYQEYYKLSYKYKKQEDKMNEKIEAIKAAIIQGVADAELLKQAEAAMQEGVNSIDASN